jgi:hypothetical protein
MREKIIAFYPVEDNGQNNFTFSVEKLPMENFRQTFILSLLDISLNNQNYLLMIRIEVATDQNLETVYTTTYHFNTNNSNFQPINIHGDVGSAGYNISTTFAITQVGNYKATLELWTADQNQHKIQKQDTAITYFTLKEGVSNGVS